MCYPGQIVHTKKANLRRGRWKFGAYNPNIEPYGLVVDARCVQLEVEWLCPNLTALNAPRESGPPPRLLNTDDFETGDIIVYNRNKTSGKAIAPWLSKASYSPDFTFGHLVRYQDRMDIPDRIPRTETQGFDMNVYQVTQTITQVR